MGQGVVHGQPQIRPENLSSRCSAIVDPARRMWPARRPPSGTLLNEIGATRTSRAGCPSSSESTMNSGIPGWVRSFGRRRSAGHAAHGRWLTSRSRALRSAVCSRAGPSWSVSRTEEDRAGEFGGGAPEEAGGGPLRAEPLELVAARDRTWLKCAQSRALPAWPRARVRIRPLNGRAAVAPASSFGVDRRARTTLGIAVRSSPDVKTRRTARLRLDRVSIAVGQVPGGGARRRACARAKLTAPTASTGRQRRRRRTIGRQDLVRGPEGRGGGRRAGRSRPMASPNPVIQIGEVREHAAGEARHDVTPWRCWDASPVTLADGEAGRHGAEVRWGPVRLAVGPTARARPDGPPALSAAGRFPRAGSRSPRSAPATSR